MRLNTFENLYADQLNDLFSAESQLIEALPKMAEAASTPQLQEAFTRHLEETRGHAETLTQLLAAIGEKAGGEKCKGMEGLLKEGKEVLEKRGEAAVKDAALIAAAQRVEHYEIAGYGTARTFALQLGDNNAVNRLQEILNQEAATDELLTRLAIGEGLAEDGINQEAAHANGHNGSRANSEKANSEKANTEKASTQKASIPKENSETLISEKDNQGKASTQRSNSDKPTTQRANSERASRQSDNKR